MEATIYLLLEGSGCIANLLPNTLAAEHIFAKDAANPCVYASDSRLHALSSRIRELSTDCVKSFELLKEDAGIMVAFEDRRHNTIEIK